MTSNATDTHPQHRAIQLSDYRVPDFLIDATHLSFDIRDGATLVTTRLTMRRNPAGVTGAPLVLDGIGLDLQTIAIDATELAPQAYTVTAQNLTIPTTPDAFELQTVVSIHPETNTSLEGLYKSSDYYCTQCEAEGFRHITYYLDRPDVLARFTVVIEGDAKTQPVLLSNGNQTHTATLPNGRHQVTWEDPHLKPCYLFALVAGDLAHIEDQFRTSEGRDVRLRIFTTEQNIDKCGHAMVSLKKSMEWDETTFGLPCDLDDYMIVVTDDFNMGAMENKGLNIFNSKYVLARPDTATDSDFAAIEGVIGHEYFHNWTGNRVTCRDWFQLSLKEGLTVFRDQQFSGAMNSPAIQRIGDVRTLRVAQFPEDAGPMAHPVRPASVIEINNFYTVTVYEKGSEVVRMYHTLLGADGFRRGMDLYFERFDGQAVTCDDFRTAMADANQRDFSQFANWYSQAGTPTLTVRADYDAAAQTYSLTLSQSCPATPGLSNDAPFHIPVAVGLLGADGADLPLRTQGDEEAESTKVLELTEASQTFTFLGVATEPTPSILRGLSAPVHLKFDYSDAQLAFLMAHDSDPFARYDAAQTLLMRCLNEGIRDAQAGTPLSLPDRVLQAFKVVLDRYTDNPALAAELLSLPSESYLGDQMEVIDVAAVHKTRQFYRHALADALRAPLTAIYHTCRQQTPYVFDADNVARRTLQSVCLNYLMTLGDAATQALCLDQFEHADNMTEVMSAVVAICHNDAPEADAALAEFHRRYSEDSLVLDKWFAIQATSPTPGALDRVKTLMKNPGFSMRNPNKVRALVGAFCQNRIHFHHADGSGHQFVAEQVLALNKLNPQIAARITGVFNHWKRFDTVRRDSMRTQLERILKEPDLSRDVYEIASKALA